MLEKTARVHTIILETHDGDICEVACCTIKSRHGLVNRR